MFLRVRTIMDCVLWKSPRLDSKTVVFTLSARQTLKDKFPAVLFSKLTLVMQRTLVYSTFLRVYSVLSVESNCVMKVKKPVEFYRVLRRSMRKRRFVYIADRKATTYNNYYIAAIGTTSCLFSADMCNLFGD